MGFYADKIFPWVLDATEPEEMAEQRRLLLGDVKGEILEIGIGTGINLPYYPDAIRRLVSIEPSASMQPRAQQRAKACGRTIEWHQCWGERLAFEAGRFDTVVSADVLCTVEDVDLVLSEAYRVLKPGGRLHFLEHGIAREDKIKKWQMRLNRLSKAVACGCDLTRDIENHLRRSSFLIEELVIVPPFAGMNIIYTHVRGVARKPAIGQ